VSNFTSEEGKDVGVIEDRGISWPKEPDLGTLDGSGGGEFGLEAKGLDEAIWGKNLTFRPSGFLIEKKVEKFSTATSSEPEEEQEVEEEEILANDKGYSHLLPGEMEDIFERAIIEGAQSSRQVSKCRQGGGLPHHKQRPRRRQKLVAGGLGTSVTLKCPYKKSCSSTTKVTWSREGREVREREDGDGVAIWIRTKKKKNSGVGELIISSLRAADEGVYTCLISNHVGSIRHNITVRAENRVVAGRPQIQVNMPGSHSVLIGSSLDLKCLLTVPAPSLVLWYHHFQKNGSWEDEAGNYHVRVVQDSRQLPEDPTSINLINVTSDDSGYYSCYFKNEYGEAVSSGWVEVMESAPVHQKMHEHNHWEEHHHEEDEHLDAGHHEVSASSSNAPLLLSAITGAVVGLLLAALALLYCTKYQKERRDKLLAVEEAQTVLRWTRQVIVERMEGEASAEVRVERVQVELAGGDGCHPGADLYSFTKDPVWEVSRDLIHLKGEIGQGAFGRVRKAEVNGGGDNSVVAVKMLKEDHSEGELIGLVKEVEIMKMVGRHENIVNLLGVCSQPLGQPLLVVLEYAELGNLREFVQKRRMPGELCFKQMLVHSTQVARGMEYLASRQCVHRDLAARNVLVTGQGVAKVADFGLARDLEGGNYYRKVGEGRLPVLWMSPESLFEGVSSTKSDVWSFGVLVWEVVTWGERPYPGLCPSAVVELVKEGHRMERPNHCPPSLYSLMMDCWRGQEAERPDWAELVTRLQELVRETQPGVYLHLPPLEVETPPSSREGSVHSVFGSIEDQGEIFVTVEDEGDFANDHNKQSDHLPGLEMVEEDPLKLTPISRRFSEESGYQSKSEAATEFE